MTGSYILQLTVTLLTRQLSYSITYFHFLWKISPGYFTHKRMCINSVILFRSVIDYGPPPSPCPFVIIPTHPHDDLIYIQVYHEILCAPLSWLYFHGHLKSEVFDLQMEAPNCSVVKMTFSILWFPRGYDKIK